MLGIVESESAPNRTIDPWPDGGLEHLDCCPVCSTGKREILYDGLTDITFGCAPGRWTLWRCQGCRCAYLDPRPNESSIALAYTRYYTHGSEEQAVGTRAWVKSVYQSIKRAAAYDYLNSRYGHAARPAILGGRWLGALSPHLARIAESWIRHLPPPATAGETVLDVGCGDGRFLRQAARLGYRAIGLEPDPKAAEAARRLGFEVSSGKLPGSRLNEGSFDHVTMNHVIEHVHDPMAAVCEAHALLRPGGRLWLATPNLGSYLAGKFKENWFPLDPPRHLTLFHCEVLARIIEKAGFKSMALMPPLFEGRFVSEASYRISRRRPPFSKSKMPNSFDDWVRESNVIAISQRDKAESITLVATKDE